MGTSKSMGSGRRDPPRCWNPWTVAVILVIGFVVCFGVLPLQVCCDWAFVCENTGSLKGYREWWTGHRSREWYHQSRLEQFMREQHPTEWKNQWTSYAGTGKSILGKPMSWGHGRPRLGTVMMTQDLFDRYVDTLDDAAKLDLYHLLVSGDREAIQAEDQKIGEIALARGWPFK